jgi:hypothetical protein
MGYLLNYKNWRALHEAAIFEAATPIIREMDESEKAALELVSTAGGGFEGFGTIATQLKNKKIFFNISAEEAAKWFVLGYLRVYAGTNWLKQSKIDGKWVERAKKDMAGFQSKLEEIDEVISSNWGENEIEDSKRTDEPIQFNRAGENSSNIYTIGKLTKMGPDTSVGRTANESNLEEVCRYVNTYNLVNHIFIAWDSSSGKEYGDPSISDEDKTKGYLNIYDSFIDNSSAKSSLIKNPDRNTQYWNEASDVYLWALADYTPPTSKTSSSTQKAKTLTLVGDKIEPAPIDAGYAALAYKPSDAALANLLNILKDAEKAGKIADLTVYGSASTEPINMGTSNQGQALVSYWRENKQPGADKLAKQGSGMTGVTEVPADAKINGTGAVGEISSDDPRATEWTMSSGNAYLAMLRANQISSYLRQKGYTPENEIYKITAGAEDARFIRVSFNIKKEDSTEIIPAKTVINTLYKAAEVTEYGSAFKCVVYDIDLF